MGKAKDRLNLLKRNNMAQITLGVQKYAPISRAHLARLTGLSITSVCRIVDELIADEMLVETGMGCGPRGRPMMLLEINSEGSPVAGVWIGGDFVEIVVASPTAKILARRTIQCDALPQNTDAAVAAIAQQVCKCAEQAGKSVDSLRAVGVSVAGMVDPISGTVLSMPNRRFWENVSVSRLLSDQLDMPVFVDNDVRAGALASRWLSDDGQNDGALYVTVANGISAAMMQGREIVAGAHNSAGMIGHMIIDAQGPLCACGKRGCLNTFASDYAFLKQIWPQTEDDFHNVSLSERRQMLQEGYSLALQCEERANEAMMSVAKHLGIGLANAIAILDPRTVFVGGALIDAAPSVVVDLIRRETMNHLMKHVRGIEIQALPNYEDFMLAGCVALVLWQPYRELQEENRDVQTVGKPEAGVLTRMVGVIR